MWFLYGIIICSSCSQIFSNLLSVSSLLTALIALLHSSKLLLVSKSETGKTIGNGIVAYISFLEIEPSAEMTSQQQHALKTENTSDVQHLQYWHKRLGHPSFGVLERIFPSFVKQCNSNDFFCDACELAKHRRHSFPSNNIRSTLPFMAIHTDEWGPSRVVTTQGYRSFVTSIYCYSCVTWIFLLHNKSEVFTCFRLSHKMVETLFNAKIKILRSYNGESIQIRTSKIT